MEDRHTLDATGKFIGNDSVPLLEAVYCDPCKAKVTKKSSLTNSIVANGSEDLDMRVVACSAKSDLSSSGSMLSERWSGTTC